MIVDALQLRDEWLERNMGDTGFPFSFVYGRRKSAALLPGLKRRERHADLDEGRIRRVLSLADPVTGLRVRCEATVYRQFPVVEWTVYLKNTGTAKTPIVKNLRALDACLRDPELGGTSARQSVRLHYAVGSPTQAEDYAPLEAELRAGTAQRVATSGGRPCNAHMPFFNLEGQSGGTILAIGWPGQWEAQFDRDTSGTVRLRVGQESTHFALLPGEEVRTPLVALLFYSGDGIDGQNVWRRWMLAHNVPRVRGKLPEPMLSGCGFLYFAPWGISNAQTLKVFIDTYEALRIPINAWWTDAGWYDCEVSIPESGYSLWPCTGTWRADRKRFPRGIREVSDHAHRKGLKKILWFEIERVRPETWLARKHPEWLLPAPRNPGNQFFGEDDHLLDLGNPAALRWAIRRIDSILKKGRVDIYREDFNMDPLLFWRANDGKDRRGIAEIRHVTGHLRLWDELRRRHPDLLIDVCASGGKRNDLEALRRAVPLHRSDYTGGVAAAEAATARLDANQCITRGIASWIPFFGTGMNLVDTYRFRSFLSPCLAFDLDPRSDSLDKALWRCLTAQFKHVAPLFMGDFYPLTKYSQQPDVWMAWQFHDPATGVGMVQAFCRVQCGKTAACFPLRGLEPEANYEIEDIDSGKTWRHSGRRLMGAGLQVRAPCKPAAMLFTYSKGTDGAQ